MVRSLGGTPDSPLGPFVSPCAQPLTSDWSYGPPGTTLGAALPAAMDAAGLPSGLASWAYTPDALMANIALISSAPASRDTVRMGSLLACRRSATPPQRG